ncbi:SDR family NAD(P)-dependent oxidoreductase [Aquiflexum lacus]|uniref:SDR family NAD(P)-dependent oxidoreductase n=1 Tax=Aquiflexum lacus TaxID=2483805 RepID=UPI0018931E57|nr:SDR family NAD(P)-dependent oxidoreductase [Aquiflexum lacus]
MKNKYVLITGASSGMGEATAILLANSGYKVFAGVRSVSAIQKLKNLRNPNIIPLKLDVTKECDITEAVDQIKSIVDSFGLFALINNAGNNYSTPTELYEEEKARNLMETHFWGMASLTRHCIPLLRLYAKQFPEGARVISVGSVGSISAFPFIQFYNAAKFAILGFTKSLRFELKPQNIHLSVILPGSVKTEIWRRTEETIQETLGNLEGHQADLYKENILAAAKLSSSLEKNGVSSENAGKIFKKVLETRRPKLKYFIGMDAKAVNFMVKYLSDTDRHWIMNKQLKFK